jgi:hypothetical protein
MNVNITCLWIWITLYSSGIGIYHLAALSRNTRPHFLTIAARWHRAKASSKYTMFNYTNNSEWSRYLTISDYSDY